MAQFGLSSGQNNADNSGFAGIWDPSSANQRTPPNTHQGFARTTPSFSDAAITWARSDICTSTSSGSWPITSSREWHQSGALSQDIAEDAPEWPSGPPIKRWQDPVATNMHEEPIEDEEMMMQDNDELEESNSSAVYASPISVKEYDKQAKEYTKNAVDQLIASPEYQKRHTTCQLCWCVWAQNQFTETCPECGAAGMEKACPVCDGRCNRLWKRDVEMSHNHHLAHWDGECGLPWEQKQGFLMQKLMDDDPTDEQLASDFSELKSS